MSSAAPQWARAAVEQREQRLREIERQLNREITPEQWSMVAEIIDGYPAQGDPWRDYYDRVTETVARHFGELGVAIRAVHQHIMASDIGQPGSCGLGPQDDEPFTWDGCVGPVAKEEDDDAA